MVPTIPVDLDRSYTNGSLLFSERVPEGLDTCGRSSCGLRTNEHGIWDPPAFIVVRSEVFGASFVEA
jgi:hypothetical protein